MTVKEQSAAFQEAAERMIDAGELSPTDAATGMERVFAAGVKTPKTPPNDAGS